MASTLCDNCQASGLPILPVRYVPVPNSVKLALPAWASGARVTDVALGGEHHYALRTLRSGFVYLFYSKNARGSNLWECFSVSEDGCLMKQPSPSLAQVAPAQFQCGRQGHSNVRLHHLIIDKPEKCGPTWIAFSEHKWSDETLKEYATNTKLRDARMQTIRPAAMAGGAKHSHGEQATEAALNEVIEYSASFGTDQLPHAAAPGSFSKADGGFDAARLVRQSTRYPWHQRQGQAAEAVKLMKDRAKKADGTHHASHVLALWDAVGMVHELNGFRNDAAGWLKLYGDERELQIAAANAIGGIKKALDRKITDDWDQVATNTAKMPDHEESGMRTRAVLLYAKGTPAQLGKPLYDLDEKLKAGQIAEAAYKAQRSRVIAANSTNPAAMEAEYAKIDARRLDLAKKRATNLADNKQSDIARTWAKYEEKIDKATFDKFKNQWETLLTRADAIVDQRTEVLIHWLEAPLLIDALEDFHSNNVQDGLLFEDAIEGAIFGMSSSKAGVSKIDAWVKEAKASVKTNLLWRAIALNQKQGIADVDAALAEAEQHKSKRTVAEALTIEGYLAKSLKAFADTYKKVVSVSNANTNASSEKGSKAFGATIRPVNMRGTDKIAVTVGDRVFRHFRVNGLGDYLSEKIIQHMFSVRAYVASADSINLIVQQARVEKISRSQTLERLRTARTFLAGDSPAIRTAQSEQLGDAWKNFKSTNKDGANAIRDARLAVVVMLIEGVNFQKLLAECRTKNDAKSWWSLAASSITISSALFDVASVPAKGVLGAESWSYQRLKLWGGFLSAGATAIGVGLDVVDAGKAEDKGQRGLAFAFYGKAFVGGMGAALTIATTFTYAAPLIERLTGRVAAGVAVRAISGVAAEVIATRILFMAAGTWITVGVFGIQCFIWIISDDKLQEWCSLCAFGSKRNAPAAYKTSKNQQEKLQEALVEVGLVA